MLTDVERHNILTTKKMNWKRLAFLRSLSDQHLNARGFLSQPFRRP